jgi:hypothetical protein
VHQPRFFLTVAASVLASVLVNVQSQDEPATPEVPHIPTASLSRASTIRLTGAADSNSPAIWDLVDGRNLMHVFTSFAGQPSLAVGPDMQRLGTATPVELRQWPNGGNWIEAVVKDVDGTLYGYYHNERLATVCEGSSKVIPRIGAARSSDRGLTWEDLGIVLQARPGSFVCATTNRYFVGGVGDLSVMLDADASDLYIFYSQYHETTAVQGVGVARLAWADRDEPVGKVTVWRDGLWMPGRVFQQFQEDGTATNWWFYPGATPLQPATDSWHDGNRTTDAFWGPSVHWNTYLRQYVMLLNRARNSDFDGEGIYVSFSSALDDPSRWSPPVKILQGGAWYPQVLGLEPGIGTDKVAGERARFFMAGRSDYFIRFSQ